MSPIREFVAILVETDVLPAAPMDNIKQVAAAIADVEDVTDPAIIEGALHAQEQLDPEKIDRANILYPIANVASFKGVLAIVGEACTARLKVVTKSRVLQLAQDALVKVDAFSVITNDMNEFKAAFARATTHANYLKPKHADRITYTNLVGQLNETMSEAFKAIDDSLGTDSIGDKVKQVSSFIVQLSLKEVDFGPEEAGFAT